MISIFKKLKVAILGEIAEPVHIVSVDINGLLHKTPFEKNPEYTMDIVGNVLKLYKNGNEVSSKDITTYLDDTNLARLVSGVIDAETGIVTFTRDDGTTFTVDMSSIHTPVVSGSNANIDGGSAVSTYTIQQNIENGSAHFVGAQTIDGGNANI